MQQLSRYFSERLKGFELYDMWLRTSAGVEDGFEAFLCFGEGVYADCMDRIGADAKWPAGDDREEDDEEEEEEENEDGLEEWRYLLELEDRVERAAANSAKRSM